MATPNFRSPRLTPDHTPGRARRPMPLDRLSEIENEKAPLSSNGAANGAANGDANGDAEEPIHELTLYDDEVAANEVADNQAAGQDESALDVADETSMREFYSRLVTLLTQENDAGAGQKKGANPFVVAVRRRWLPALLLLGLAFFGLYSLLKPREATYTASTVLLLPPREAANNKDPFAPPEDSYDTAAQLAIISSDKIVANALSHVPADLRRKGWGAADVQRVPVNATALDSDSLVTISTASLDARASASLVDEMVVAYRDYTNSRYSQNKGENLVSTRDRLKKTGLDLANARRQLRDYKERTGIFDATSQQSSSALRINDLETALSTARREDATAANSDPTVQELRQRAVDAGAKLRAILRDFEPSAERARIAQQDYDLIQAQANARASQLASASARRISQLESAVKQARSDAANLPAAEQDLNRLNERVTLLETAYRSASGRADQLSLSSGAIAPVATTLQPTDVGSDMRMKRVRALGVSMLGALLIALACALGLDRLDRSVRTTRDPDALFEAPVLGALPAGKASNALFIGHARTNSGARARTATLEACYNAQSHILGAAAAAGARSILFTSALPGEGKSQCAANLAAAMAYGGRQVLLIDGDFWNPTQHETLEQELAPGYAQVLRDEALLSQAIRATSIANLHLLSAGQKVEPRTKNGAGNSGELIALLVSDNHRHTMETLARFFDVIIVDAPPVMSVSDAQLLASLTDATVLVTAARTNRDQVQRARSMLRLAGADLLGVVINSVRAGEIQRWNVDFSPEEPFSHYSNSLSTY